jgi:hypothetical protein
MTAKSTLEARGAKYGMGSPHLKAWLVAQDMVFQNCSEGSGIPEKLPAGSDALDRDDRDYQIAAAHFYSGQFVVARDEFLTIGKHAESPWRTGALSCGAGDDPNSRAQARIRSSRRQT